MVCLQHSSSEGNRNSPFHRPNPSWAGVGKLVKEDFVFIMIIVMPDHNAVLQEHWTGSLEQCSSQGKFSLSVMVTIHERGSRQGPGGTNGAEIGILSCGSVLIQSVLAPCWGGGTGK